ncbi:hypothetical protein G6514_002697 [Epicoccum nigrum]|nr:hypothetical protein G6514_002697 [Epicoccum nigrum]
MKSSVLFAAAGLAGLATAASSPDAQITAAAQLGKHRRQADPALLGYISADGASSFSDARTCDFPATLSSSGSLAQCCSGSDCVFWSSCSAGTLFAQATSLRCDQGYCNTAVLVATPGAKSGESYLGCWATSLGEGPFTIVKDVGSAIATPTATASEESASASASATVSTRASAASGTRSSASASAKSSASRSASAEASGTATESSTSETPSTGAAVANAAKPLTGAVGLLAMFFGLL